MPERNPVLLIHGWLDTRFKFNEMAAYLSGLGWDVHRIDLIPSNGSALLPDLAQQVASYINETFPTDQPIDLLGYSMGGIVTRYYLQRMGGLARVQRYISLSAPNRGTVLSYGLSFLAGIAQMRPFSQLLKDLNQDVAQQLGCKDINVTVLWTPLDAMILPPQSSSLGIGHEHQVPVLFHHWMVRDPRVLKRIAWALAEPLSGDRQSLIVPENQTPPQGADKI